MEIRPAQPGDVSRLAELNAVVQEMHREVAPEWFKAPSLAATTRYFADLLTAPGVSIFVADADGTLEGYVMARVHQLSETALTMGGLVVELDQIAVDPRARQKGIGRELIRRVIVLAREIGATRLQLTVWEFNERARSVFEREGFSTATRRMLRAP